MKIKMVYLLIGMNVKLLWLNFICFLFKKSLCYKVNVDLFLIWIIDWNKLNMVFSILFLKINYILLFDFFKDIWNWLGRVWMFY